MDTERMRYFICVAECLSFTQAARQLYISQPTLSNKIADLEGELGVPLFDRTTRSVSLTGAGEYFFAEARQIIHNMDELTIRVKAMSKGKFGRLSFGFLDIIAYRLIEATISNFTHNYPDIKLQIQKLTHSELTRFVADGTVDLAFIMNYRDPGLSNIAYKKILSSRLMVLLPKDHHLANQSSIKLNDLENEPLLSVRKSDALTLVNTITSICNNKGFPPKFVGECSGPEELAISVSSGLGIAIVSYFLSSVLSYSKNLRLIPISHITTTTDLYFVYRKDNPNPCIQAMLECAVQTSAEINAEEPRYLLPE